MNGPGDEAAEVGRDVGIEMGKAAEDLRAMFYRTVRRLRWLDGTALAVLLLLACAGVRWPWITCWFVVSLTFDLVMCRKLNPKRARGRAAS